MEKKDYKHIYYYVNYGYNYDVVNESKLSDIESKLESYIPIYIKDEETLELVEEDTDAAADAIDAVMALCKVDRAIPYRITYVVIYDNEKYKEELYID